MIELNFARLRTCAGCLFLFSQAYPLRSFSQEGPTTQSLLAVHAQCRTIAAQLLDSIPRIAGSRVHLAVTDHPVKTVVENAFIGACQNRNIRVILDPGQDATETSVTLLVLHAGSNYRDIGKLGFQRTTATAIEARYRPGGSDEVKLLGTFHRQQSDTVLEREIVPAAKEPGSESRAEEGGFLQRMITPMVVMAGSMIIVLLFFAVRS